jgi:hypothetical protein
VAHAQIARLGRHCWEVLVVRVACLPRLPRVLTAPRFRAGIVWASFHQGGGPLLRAFRLPLRGLGSVCDVKYAFELAKQAVWILNISALGLDVKS